jgi:hypothetical protein
MIVLYSYPELFGVAENNGYGLKVFAFMRLACLPFTHEHIFDASAAPRGQLPYITDDGVAIGDSENIIAHLTSKYRLTIDAALNQQQRDNSHLITRMLDDLYWVMSYSRWKDERYWPAFRDALMREHPNVTEDGLRKAQEFNFQRLLFRGHRALRTRRGLRPRARRSSRVGRFDSGGWLRSRVKADEHRCRHLRLPGQHLFLRHRHAAETVRHIAAKSGAPLPRDPRSGDERLHSLPTAVKSSLAHDKAGVQFIDRPGRREAGRG